MLSEPTRADQEIAHVLFMDLVKYSRLSIDDQSRMLSLLQDIVRDTPEFRRADAAGDLIRVPTGDGVALVFFRDPASPAHCALEVARAMQFHPRIRLRMGIHSGPIQRVQDINGNVNVSGSGINTAQRVMDCGDDKHILVSHILADLLRQLGGWAPYLHDLGECEVKHGERIHIYNLHTEELGNREIPEQLLPRLRASTLRRADSVEGSLKIAILYKRKAQPDEQILQMLENRLAAIGHRVFIDRHLSMGVEWAREIERQVRTADAVIPLISELSMASEMLEWEVDNAFKAQQDHGKPWILPIRVQYEGALPPGIGAVLDPLEYTLWESEADDDRVVEEIARALGSHSPPPAARSHKLEAVGGAVPLDSRFYVVRATDAEFEEAIGRRDSIVLVKGARQMGKTSLLARGLQTAREAGSQVVMTDFQKLSSADLAAPENLYQSLGESIADQLDLDILPRDAWDDRRGPSANFERYLRREVLKRLNTPLVWAMDEVDRLFSPSCAYASEVFGLFRSWHNERALDPSGPWSSLTMAIAYATEAHLFITDINQSPFNVGTRLTLDEFTFDQLQDLNVRCGSPLRSTAETARFFRLLGGHPYLTRRGLNEMASRGMEITAFEAQASRDDGIFGDHLRRILVLIAPDESLSNAIREVLSGQCQASADVFYRLRSAGIISGDSARGARMRCQLYSDYLSRSLQ